MAADPPQPTVDQPVPAVTPSGSVPITRDAAPEAIASQEQAGAVLAGKYKLLERIGMGGMGSVWMAQQTEPVKRTVAVKLIKDGGDSKAMLAPFEAERQALAMMDHPNIAKVFDAGTTPQGAPFFVMELVKGAPISKYCDAHKLTPRQRLELFLPVCQAIQHAHQKGIIHRDIKPSNVLVALYDDKPIPKVIDFGLAKATISPLTDLTLHTGFGAIVGTPLYMSPEQATLNNLDIDTRSDIYSLGVLLYELLAGSPPFSTKELQNVGMLEILRIIREEEPPKPSTKLSTAEALPTLAANRGTEPAKLSRQLRGEIDWIVMKALDKDRVRRYETANGFALDIQRYLNDEPVLAGPPSAVYRLKKFVKRNKGPVLAASLVLLALIGGVAGTTLGLIRADRARQEAEKQSERANANFDKARQAVDEYLTQVSENKLLNTPLPGMQPLRKELLTTALKYYQGFAEEHADDPKLQAELAAAYLRMGKITSLIDSKEQALQPLGKALAIYEQLERDHPTDFTVQRGLVDTEAAMAEALSRGKRTAEALRYFDRAEAHGEKLVRQQPQDAGAQYELAQNYNVKGLFQSLLGTPDEALKSHERALTLLRKLIQDHPREARYQITLARVHGDIGYCRLYTIHEPAKALKHFEDALAVHQMLPAVEAQNVTAQTYLGETYGGITNCYFYLQEKKKCLTASQRTVAIWEKLARENPRVPVYQSMAAMSLNNLGQHLNLNGQNKEAQQALQQAIDVGQKGLSMDPNMGSLAFAVAQAYGTRGDFFLDDSHFQEAAADAEKAVSYMNLAIQKGNDPNCRLYIGNYYFVLGTAQSKLGQREKAQATWIQGPLVWENYMKENPTNVGFKDRVAEKLLYLALAQGEAGLPEEMHGSWQRSMQLGAEVIGAKPEDLAFRTKLASLSHECATFLLRKDQPKEALPAVQKAIELQLVVCEKKPDSAKDGELLATFRSTLAAAQAKRPK